MEGLSTEEEKEEDDEERRRLRAFHRCARPPAMDAPSSSSPEMVSMSPARRRPGGERPSVSHRRAATVSAARPSYMEGFSPSSPSQRLPEGRAAGLRQQWNNNDRRVHGAARRKASQHTDNVTLEMNATLEQCRTRCLADYSCVAYAPAGIPISTEQVEQNASIGPILPRNSIDDESRATDRRRRVHCCRQITSSLSSTAAANRAGSRGGRAATAANPHRYASRSPPVVETKPHAAPPTPDSSLPTRAKATAVESPRRPRRHHGRMTRQAADDWGGWGCARSALSMMALFHLHGRSSSPDSCFGIYSYRQSDARPEDSEEKFLLLTSKARRAREPSKVSHP
ncbi:hypothetical protein PR202_gb14245 [Eleusine coracana subsp. coracana]|uniref:Apple domain-containing protein n=1 Tax=Eleusine coracana subsp. coracana TaxID=191504 RepID=A0AAV5EUW4_ELECO|nr:hypothetical protein PR202_gb14245 [Eleusine coracana subsp. coracana]